MASLPTFPISTATFRSDTYNFDPLLAGECISQSAKIAGSLGVLKRGTVLFGPAAPAPITTATLLTTVPTGASARVILAQDIDTTGGAVTGLVYTQGKFLDTAMIFSSQGAAADCAALWDYGVYVLTVEQRSGLLVPMISLPATGGALPQAFSPKDAAKALKDEVEAIKDASPGSVAFVAAKPPGGEAAWAIAAFGETEPTKEEQALAKAAEQSYELDEKQLKARDELIAKQHKELGDLAKKQNEERAHLAKQEADAIQQARQANSNKEPPAANAPKKER